LENLFRFYDGSLIMISGRAQVFKIFIGLSTDTFKMTFSKFKFI